MEVKLIYNSWKDLEGKKISSNLKNLDDYWIIKYFSKKWLEKEVSTSSVIFNRKIKKSFSCN